MEIDKNQKFLEMDYWRSDLMIENAKYILDNYNFVSEEKEYNLPNGSMLVQGPNYFLDVFFNKDFFIIEGTGEKQYFFGNKEYVDWLETLDLDHERKSLDDALKEDKKIILTYNLHPKVGQDEIEGYKTEFFDVLFKDDKILQACQSGKLIIYFYFGYEADNFYIKDENIIGNYTRVFNEVQKEYNLPKNFLIIFSSNLNGDDYKREYEEQEEEQMYGTVYDNIIEIETFKSIKGNINVEYTFDDYIENIKKSKKPLLRINRTHLVSRDLMLWYLYTSGNISKTIVEHQSFIDNVDVFRHELSKVRIICEENNLEHLKKYFEFDESLLKRINSDLPLIASKHEQTGELDMGDVFSNEPIPHDVYKDSIFSWVSTSLAFREEQVFINASTFNPMLNYHPIIYKGNYQTARYLKKFGFMGYNFLYDEDRIDNKKNELERLVFSTNEIHRLLSMDKDDLIQLIIQNRNVMEYNRKVLFECRSIYRMLSKFTNLLKEHERLVG